MKTAYDFCVLFKIIVFRSLAIILNCFIAPIITCYGQNIVINNLSWYLLHSKSIKINVLYIIIQRPLHNMNISPFSPPSPCTNFNLFSPLAIYTCISILSSTFHNPLQNPSPFLNVIYVCDRKLWLIYNIDAFYLSETFSTYFCCHFQKFFQKKKLSQALGRLGGVVTPSAGKEWKDMLSSRSFSSTATLREAESTSSVEVMNEEADASSRARLVMLLVYIFTKMSTISLRRHKMHG